MYKTGGGSNTNLLSKTTEKIIGLLGDQMDPLINSVDSDTNYNDGKYLQYWEFLRKHCIKEIVY